MAFARDVYTAAGSQTDFTITYGYLDQDDVLVYDAGTLKTITTDYTLPNATTIRFNSSVTNGNVVLLKRSSNQSTRLVDYTAGALSEADLDQDSLQAFYMAQEAIDESNSWAYESAETALNNDAQITFAHGLGALPSIVEVILRANTATSQGWADNEEGTFLFPWSGALADDGVDVTWDATNIYITQGSAIQLLDHTSFNHETITQTQYDWVVRARRS